MRLPGGGVCAAQGILWPQRGGAAPLAGGVFGGHSEALPRNWRERFAGPESKPIKIGKRLMIVGSINEVDSRSVRCSQRSFHRAATRDALRTAQGAAYDTK